MFGSHPSKLFAHSLYIEGVNPCFVRLGEVSTWRTICSINALNVVSQQSQRVEQPNTGEKNIFLISSHPFPTFRRNVPTPWYSIICVRNLVVHVAIDTAELRRRSCRVVDGGGTKSLSGFCNECSVLS